MWHTIKTNKQNVIIQYKYRLHNHGRIKTPERYKYTQNCPPKKPHIFLNIIVYFNASWKHWSQYILVNNNCESLLTNPPPPHIFYKWKNTNISLAYTFQWQEYSIIGIWNLHKCRRKSFTTNNNNVPPHVNLCSSQHSILFLLEAIIKTFSDSFVNWKN